MTRILVVDDEAALAVQLKERLTKMGYEVVGKASSGEAAIEMARRFSPDLVFMDIVLPGKIDGIKAAEVINENLDIPIVFVTGHAINEFINRAKSMGPFGYLLKPIRNRDIKPTIDMALYKKEMEMGLQKAHRELGKQVEERTAELSEANRNLKREIRVRKKAEVALMGSLEKLSAEHDKRVFLSKQLIDLLERERKQLSMDLHDDVGQVLTGIKMATEIMLDEMKKRDDELTGEMALLKERTTHLIKKIRDFSRLLRPNILERFGLIASFKQLFAGIEKDSRLRIHLFTSGGEERFDNEKELACFRIVQEALNNIINHAGAKEVFVNFVKKDKMLSLSVEDDGAGFEPENINHITDGKGPLGILIMEERAQKAGGTFSIDSQVGRGTRVMVEMLGV